MSYYQRATQTGEWDWTSDTTNWFHCKWGYTLGLTIDDDVTNIHAVVEEAYITPTHAEGGGSGFYNSLGICFDVHNSGSHERYLPLGGDTWDKMSEDIEFAFQDAGSSDYGNKIIVWCWHNDGSGNYGVSAANTGVSFDIAITEDMKNPTGGISATISVLSLWNRWLRWDSSHSDDHAVTGVDPGFVNLSGESFDPPIDWSYYPWAIRKSGVWKSHNREGGYLKSRESGEFTDSKNSLYPPPKTTYRRINGVWLMCPKIGEE